ncbi:YuzB family protein [Aliicoccus persicus]|uniref:Uncharacterized protein YuzB, UPF0349 family n=1 Tax=Aliicoccus persicus TaxID=930138 RepID=A0A662Z5Q4_9STAP|nr:YuzB family protein [Aliicoccus persicus]SEW01893.1 Uncharacterized protein YuzB, UPF0349 family [Aliicoccus persicus]
MYHIVEFCSSNMLKGSQNVYDTLQKDPELDVVDYGCLSNCGICSKMFFAYVNGKTVSGKTPEQLLERIYKQIEKEDEKSKLDRYQF